MRQVAAAVRLRGRLDIEALRNALTGVAKRHSALRTYVTVEDGTPLQNILPEPNCGLDIIDLTGSPLPVREEKLRALVEEYIVRTIDVSRAPLFGVALFRVREHEHVLLVAMEHLISDAFSLDLLMREVLTTYCGLLNGDMPIPAQPTMQFSEYAAWQNRTINAWLAEHEAYWRACLSDVENVRIPIAAQRKSSAEWATVTLQIDRPMKDALNKLARAHGTTLVMCMFAAYVALIAHCSRRDEAFLQFQINGRTRPELEESIGFFASVLYLRVPVAREDTFLDLLRRVVDEHYRTAAHADSYYMASRTPRPEFARTSIFNWVPERAPIDLDLSALQDSPHALGCEAFPVSNKAVQRFQWDNDPMTVLFDGENQIAIAIHFPRERFSIEEMERFAGRYSSLLAAMAHDARRQLGSVAFWDETT